MQECDSIQSCKGVGEKTAQAFKRLGIETVGELLRHYPVRYDQFGPAVSVSDAPSGQIVAIRGRILTTPKLRRTGRLSIVTAEAGDDTGRFQLTWFNMPYLKNTIKKGSERIFRGRLVRNRFGIAMEQPTLYIPEDYEKLGANLQPVYSSVEGLTSSRITKTLAQVLEQIDLSQEYLPQWIRTKYLLAEWNYAVRTIHFPPDQEELLFARRRLVFDEFLFFILAVRSLKEKREENPNNFHIIPGASGKKVLELLPYKLTGAQKRVLCEIQSDMSGPTMMNRLIQGDVGSGKTILALLALLDVVDSGYQGALMAPTEVLARQHYESFLDIMNRYELPVRIELLTGSMKVKEKREAYQRIASHEVDIIIGTHALIQEKVEYDRLALVITDEQHRFGVRQRETFSQKGEEPHILVMSATPIPRTLAIILYGDLDISVVDELPVNRLPIKNCVVDTSFRPKAYEFIRKELQNGRQAYVICPMVEAGEESDAENVIDYTEKLRSALPESVRVEYLHGKMRPKDKNERMEQFAGGEIQVLVSTTVVEVGVNVPNATVMMIENAERFGLAQLHQLRGRVGRGKHQSYCIFIDGSGDGNKQKRLEILNKTNDGFQIASEDLKLRGPGDVFGIRQSGTLEFAIGDIFTDSRILQDAAEAAELLMESNLLSGENDTCLLREKLEEYQNTSFDRLYL